ncbi:MAG: hypothetical protein OEW87_07015 [Flavobacteriaceae bacterium]|nr:hypothetical protein [Flavobacteriaceae bacterium]
MKTSGILSSKEESRSGSKNRIARIILNIVDNMNALNILVVLWEYL